MQSVISSFIQYFRRVEKDQKKGTAGCRLVLFSAAGHCPRPGVVGVAGVAGTAEVVLGA